MAKNKDMDSTPKEKRGNGERMWLILPSGTSEPILFLLLIYNYISTLYYFNRKIIKNK